jgi:hypothetical protein
MATLSIIKLKVRRGLDVQRKQITLDDGELGYVTDGSSKRLFVGDGVTRGGIPSGIKLFYTAPRGSTYLQTAQVGDLIYDNNNTQFFTITGTDSNGFPDYLNVGSYQFVGPSVDNSTVQYSAGGSLKIKPSGVTQTEISSTALGNALQGGSGSVLSVKYDNTKIVLSSGSLTVSEAGLNLANLDGNTLPTVSPGAGTKKLWNNGGVVTVA